MLKPLKVYDVEGAHRRDRPKITWKENVDMNTKSLQLNKEDGTIRSKCRWWINGNQTDGNDGEWVTVLIQVFVVTCFIQKKILPVTDYERTK